MLAVSVIVMSAWIPFALGQSSFTSASSVRPATTLRPLNSVVSSVVASRSATVVTTSSSVTPTSSSAAAARPTLQFATIDALESCDTTDISWAIAGVDSDRYEISLFVIDAGDASSSSSSPSTSASRSPVPSSSAVIRTTSPIATISSASASASARSTALVGRALQVRQSQTQANKTLVTGQSASRPYRFNVALAAGRYYISGSLNDTLRTTARSNVFTVQQGANTSCLAVGISSSSASRTSRTSISGGVMQTGAGASPGTTSTGISGGAIAGIVIGIVGGLGILAFLALCCLRRRRRRARTRGMEGDKSDQFAALPSASSHDGDKIHRRGQGYPIAGAWRRNSDLDEKTMEADDPYANTATLNRQKALPFPGSSSASGEQEILTASDLPPSLGETRRQSGPPTTHTLVQKTSMQGIIGKESSSTESSMPHSRSSSFGATSRPPVTQQGSGQKDSGGLSRNTSSKRKPVPSLGPELRSQLERERKLSEGGGGVSRKPSVPEPRRYSLVPDKPFPQM